MDIFINETLSSYNFWNKQKVMKEIRDYFSQKNDIKNEFLSKFISPSLHNTNIPFNLIFVDSIYTKEIIEKYKISRLGTSVLEHF